MSPGKLLHYIAVLPGEPVLSEVLHFKNEIFDRFGARVALKSPAHITLFPPLLLSETEVLETETILARTAGVQPSFPVKLRGFGCFEPRVIFVAVQESEALDTLYQTVQHALCESLPVFAKAAKPLPFHPHISIANRDLSEEQFQQAWKDFAPRPYAADFNACQLTLLVHSPEGWQIRRQFPFKG